MWPLSYYRSQWDIQPPPPNQIEFIKNVLVDHIRGLPQIYERPLLNKNQMRLNHFSVLHKGWLKKNTTS